jgi:hypothetical protein
MVTEVKYSVSILFILFFVLLVAIAVTLIVLLRRLSAIDVNTDPEDLVEFVSKLKFVSVTVLVALSVLTVILTFKAYGLYEVIAK